MKSFQNKKLNIIENPSNEIKIIDNSPFPNPYLKKVEQKILSGKYQRKIKKAKHYTCINIVILILLLTFFTLTIIGRELTIINIINTGMIKELSVRNLQNQIINERSHAAKSQLHTFFKYFPSDTPNQKIHISKHQYIGNRLVTNKINPLIQNTFIADVLHFITRPKVTNITITSSLILLLLINTVAFLRI
jgi:hypothetical protein